MRLTGIQSKRTLWAASKPWGRKIISRCIGLILTYLRSSNRGSFQASRKGTFELDTGIIPNGVQKLDWADAKSQFLNHVRYKKNSE